MNYFHRVQKMTSTRFWINNVTLEEADKAIEEGACGCTQNPSYVWKMLQSDDASSIAIKKIKAYAMQDMDKDQIIVALQRDLVAGVASKFLPMYKKSNGRVGHVSIQADPFHEDYDTLVNTARFNRTASPNIMIKIPVTEEGLKAVNTCIKEGMSVNATEVMSLQQAIDLCDVYDMATQGMENPPVVYISHIAGIFDEYLSKYVAAEGIDISKDYLYLAGKIVAHKIRTYMDNRKTAVGFINGGARGLQHFTEWVGANITSTINWKGTAEDLILSDPPVVSRFYNPIDEHVLDVLIAKLPDFRKAYYEGGISQGEYEEFGPVKLFCSSFRSAWKNALEKIELVTSNK